MIKRFIGMVFLVLAIATLGCISLAFAYDSPEFSADGINGAIAIVLDTHVRGFIMIHHDGSHQLVSALGCLHVPACMEVVKRFADSNTLEAVRITREDAKGKPITPDFM